MIAPRQHWRDAVDTHTALTRWCQSEFGHQMLCRRADMITEEMTVAVDARWLIQGLYASEGAALAGAVPFFVSADMCELVAHASQSFQPEPIYPTDVLDLNGFMFFERPITIPDRFGRPSHLAAVSWTVIMDADETADQARVLSRDDEMREFLEQRHERGLVDGLGLTLWERAPEKLAGEHWGPRPPLLPTHVTPWAWGMEFEGNEVTAEGRPTGTEHWWRIVQTTWRLMAQTIVVRHSQQIARPQRRERMRLGYRPDDVIVVTLRRERGESSGEEGEGTRHYTHRWINSGHWRNQWYPSAGVHRQIYIAPYVKGPEAAPLIIKPRAYNWTR